MLYKDRATVFGEKTTVRTVSNTNLYKHRFVYKFLTYIQLLTNLVIMVDQRLINYINESRSKNISNEEITRKLQERGIPLNLVQDALNITVPTPHLTKDIIITELTSEKPPISIKIISFLFLITSGFYYFSTFALIGLLLQMNSGMIQAYDPSFALLRAAPILGILPLATVLSATIIAYVGLKIRCGSKKSFWFGISLLTFITLLLLILGFFVGSQMSTIYKNTSNY